MYQFEDLEMKEILNLLKPISKLAHLQIPKLFLFHKSRRTNSRYQCQGQER